MPQTTQIRQNKESPDNRDKISRGTNYSTSKGRQFQTAPRRALIDELLEKENTNVDCDGDDEGGVWIDAEDPNNDDNNRADDTEADEIEENAHTAAIFLLIK